MDQPQNVTPLRAVPRSTNMRTLTLTVEQVGLVLSGLQELPYRASAGLIHEVIRQANAPADAPETPPDAG